MKRQPKSVVIFLISVFLLLALTGPAFGGKVYVKDSDSSEALVGYLKQPDPTRKKHINHIRAAKLLGERKYQPAVPALIKALQYRNPKLIKFILIALGKIGDASARPAIEVYLNHRKKFVRKAAKKALANLSKGPATPVKTVTAPVEETKPTPTTPEPLTRPKVAPGLKTRIAVIDFLDKTTYSMMNLGSSAYYMLVTALVKSDNFIVVERNALQKVLKEQTRGLGGSVDQNTAAEVGRILGVNTIVLGAVLEFGMAGGTSRAVVDVRLVDTKTAQILLAESAEGLGMAGHGASDDTKATTALRKAIGSLVYKIIDRVANIPWEGRIMQVSGEKIYINAGRNSGLKQGTLLTVYREGEELIDPTTGLRKGFEEEKIGLLLVTKLRMDYSMAMAQSGIGFMRNDLVRIEPVE